MAKSEYRLPQQLCRALVALRKAQGMKQTDIARLTGLSPSYISQLEAGDKVPSLEVLMHKIAPAYNNRNIWRFFSNALEGANSLFSITKTGDALNKAALGNLEVEVFPEDAIVRQEMCAYLITVPKYTYACPDTPHPGEEMIYVLSGKVLLRYGEVYDEQVLAAAPVAGDRNDLAHYKAGEKHYVINPYSEPARLLVIRTWPLSSQLAAVKKMRRKK